MVFAADIARNADSHWSRTCFIRLVRVAGVNAVVVPGADVATCAIFVAEAFIWRRGRRRNTAVVFDTGVHDPLGFFEAFFVASICAVEAFV